MTNCTVCGLPCVGSEDTSNPFCLPCYTLNLAGNEYDRALEASTTAQRSRRQTELARLMAAGVVRQEEGP